MQLKTTPKFGEGTLEHLRRVNTLLGQGLSPEEAIGKLLKSQLELALDLFVTEDDGMNKVKDKIRKIMRQEERDPTGEPPSVLITGPTGTGKELLAKSFAEFNTAKEGYPYKRAPFIPVNCGGLPENLIQSLFFGHKKGAFTGALTDHQGYLVSAQNGVVLLDELLDFPVNLQALLLRAIQEREVYPVGSSSPTPISCRFVAATCKNLDEALANKSFREDLYARLSTFELQVSPLSLRQGDIPIIGHSLGGLVDWFNPLPEKLLSQITRLNVRAIQTYIARMRTYGEY